MKKYLQDLLYRISVYRETERFKEKLLIGERTIKRG